MRIHRLSTLVPVLAILALLVPAGTAVAQIVPPLDHFLVYEHAPFPAGFNVALRGQFDVASINTNLPQHTHFANPVKKTHSGVTTPIADPWRHLLWYRIVSFTSEPIRTVRYSNQFGDASVRIQNPVFLLVPAEKLSHVGGSQPPTNADHYKCYEVIALGVVPPTPIVTLSDQFQTRPNVGVFSPRYFCVPVRKTHNGVIHGIFNAQEHLVVYDLSPWIFQKGVITRDQFMVSEFATQRAVWLAVPTKKLAWAVTSVADPTSPDGP